MPPSPLAPVLSPMARRLLSWSGCLEPRSAAKARELVAKLVRGEDLTPADMAPAMSPARRGSPLGFIPGDAAGKRLEEWDVELYEPLGDDGQVALICVDGPIYFGASIWDLVFSGAIPTDALVASIDQATADKDVQTICFSMNTPGGTVAGASDLTAAMDRAKAAGKRLVCVVHEMACSMGVYVAAQCDEVVLTPTALMGSVGTLIMQYDDSELFKELGVEPKPIGSTPRKSQGYPGVPIDDKLSDDGVRIVEKHFGEFVAIVAKGRGMTPAAVRALEARVYLGSDAVTAGLADEVVGFDDYLARLTGGEAEPAPAPPVPTNPAPTPDAPGAPTDTLEKDDPMDLTKLTIADLAKDRPDLVAQLKGAEAQPASIKDLKAAFPGAENAEFREDCAEKGLTLVGAKAAYGDVLQERNKAAALKLTEKEKELADLKALGTEGLGTDPVGAGNDRGGAGGAAGKFKSYDAAMQYHIKNGVPKSEGGDGKPMTPAQASKHCNAAYPELRQAHATARPSATPKDI